MLGVIGSFVINVNHNKSIVGQTEASVYFFALMQKSNKKDQGFRKMAKNYCISLNSANSLRRCNGLADATGSDPANGGTEFLPASQEDGLLRNFLNAIFLRPSLNYALILPNLVFSIQHVCRRQGFNAQYSRKICLT
jgi:hypothetical protein